MQLQSALAIMLRSSGRLVNAGVIDPDERERQTRLIKLLLFGPFFFVATTIAVSAGRLPASSILAISCAGLAFPWIAAGLLAISGNALLVSAASLLVASAALAALVSLGGGVYSPLVMLVFALPAEAYWVTRSWQSALAGLVAAIAAIATQFFIHPLFDGVEPAHWFIPFAYYLVLVWRAEPPLIAAGRVASAGDLRNVRIIEKMNAGIVDYGQGSDVIATSGQIRRIFKVDGPFLLGNGLFNRIHVGDRVAYLAALSDVRNGSNNGQVALRIRVPSELPGEPDCFREFSAEFVRVGDEGPAVSAILRPVPEIQQLRNELKETAELASHNEIAKSRFLAAVSHELRTPLNAIIGFSDILLHEMFGKFTNDKQREYVDLVRQSGRHLLSVVNAILDVSKIEAGTYAINPEPCDIKGAVSMCVSMLRPQADEKNVAIENRVGPLNESVIADPRAVQQILINLVSNAVKFTPSGGQVSIGSRLRDGMFELTVADNGIGIARKDMERLGRPFVQVQNDYTRNFEGTGLGLSLVKGLVELHEGGLKIESEPGSGTTVTVTLPLSGPAAKPAPTYLLKNDPKETDRKENGNENRRTA